MTSEGIRARRRALQTARQPLLSRLGELTAAQRAAEDALGANTEEIRDLQKTCMHPNGVRRGPRSKVYGTDVVHCDDCGFDRPMDTL